jgi:hypothetical protein
VGREGLSRAFALKSRPDKGRLGIFKRRRAVNDCEKTSEAVPAVHENWAKAIASVSAAIRRASLAGANEGAATRLHCADCEIDTSFTAGNGDYYAARDDVWREASAASEAILCLDCLGRRIGRSIVADDLVLTPPEILDRFCNQARLPPSPPERQHELESWRAWRRKLLQTRETDTG